MFKFHFKEVKVKFIWLMLSSRRVQTPVTHSILPVPSFIPSRVFSEVNSSTGNSNIFSPPTFQLSKMESSKSTKPKKPLTVEEEDLVDGDKDIFDPILSFDLFEIHQLALQNFRDLVDHYHA
jgi:hypothetical protein